MNISTFERYIDRRLNPDGGPRLREHLDAFVPAVHDPDVAGRPDLETDWVVELPLSSAVLPPTAQVVTGRCEYLYPVIAEVGNEHLALLADRDPHRRPEQPGISTVPAEGRPEATVGVEHAHAAHA